MASLANVVFSGSIAKLGWNGIVTMWYILLLVGAAASFFKLAKDLWKLNLPEKNRH